jgi:hypothetical protein
MIINREQYKTNDTWEKNFQDAYRRSKAVYNRKRRFKVPEYVKQFIIKFPPELSYLCLYPEGICIVLNYSGYKVDVNLDYDEPDWFFLIYDDEKMIHAYDADVSTFDYSKIKDILHF